ncbi:hypothetical protein NUW54_g701 [Trametes sanguinea]|uniref:Uncharacterized protein n=1 Tax=Trametes sanguinea TaxID=158606 RepID=A0ACC1QAB4_9APHY|nr:hypothetical protein NUW54_g701 [Trametes sanguinea]
MVGNIEETKTRQVQVERKSSGLWWIVGGKEEASNQSASSNASSKPSAAPKKAASAAKPSNSTSTGSKLLSKPPPPKPSASKLPTPARTGPLFSLPALPFLRPTPQPQQTILQTITAQVPLWLLAATEALSTLSNEHPDVLTAIAAGIVAVGTVSTGGSAVVAAIGEAAVVMGRALKNAHDKTHSR